MLREVDKRLVVDFLNISVNYSGTISRHVSAANDEYKARKCG